MTAYEKRVQELEDEGLTTSDAQGVADMEFESEVLCENFNQIFR
jgi:hypothetical protein